MDAALLLPRRWGLSDEARERLIERMVAIATSEGVAKPTAIRAFRALVEAEKVDLDYAKTAAVVTAAMKMKDESKNPAAGEILVSQEDLVDGVARLIADRDATKSREDPNRPSLTHREAVALSMARDEDSRSVAG